MDIRYDSVLMEAMVTQEMRDREEKGYSSLSRQYHAHSDPLYKIDSLGERSKAFRALFQKLFVKWRLGRIFDDAIEEFPLFEDVELTYFKMTSYRKNAGADLMAKNREAGPRVIMVQVLASYLNDKAGLRDFLRHEFMHVSDILDEAFRYEEALTEGVPAESWVMDRYRLLWDMHIDGRLSGEGKLPANGKTRHLEEFDRLYRKVPEQQRGAVFEWIWNAGHLTHGDILDLAKDTMALMRKAGIADGLDISETDLSEGANLPGSPCPLCKFPTYHWEENLPTSLENQVKKVIEENHPGWTPHDGACPRCIEGYRSLAGNNRLLLHHAPS